MIRRYVHGLGAGDDPLVWFEGSGVADSARRYLYADERGSIVAVTNSAGTVLDLDTYDEYGIAGSANAGRFQYTGQAWVPELGMYYYKARMYSPTLGRFMQTDPIGYGDGTNMYAYVGNDPVNGVDPTGLFELPCNTSNDTIVVCGGRYRPPAPLTPDEIQCTINGNCYNYGQYCGIFGCGDGGVNLTPANQQSGAPVAPAKEQEDGETPQNQQPANQPSNRQCPVGINERNYPIPPGYTSAGMEGNRFVRDGNGRIQMNPNYAAARAKSEGTDWSGVFWDLATIAFGSITGGLFGEGVTAGEAAVTAVGGAGVVTGQELSHSDGC